MNRLRSLVPIAPSTSLYRGMHHAMRLKLVGMLLTRLPLTPALPELKYFLVLLKLWLLWLLLWLLL